MKTIQSKAGELILVPVPKGYDFNIEDDYWSVYITGVNTKGERHLIWFNDIFNRFPHLEKGIDHIIGLSSQITEEQAKELATEMDDPEYVMGIYYHMERNEMAKMRNTAKEAVEQIINDTIVLTEDQDCLILLKKEK